MAVIFGNFKALSLDTFEDYLLLSLRDQLIYEKYLYSSEDIKEKKTSGVV